MRAELVEAGGLRQAQGDHSQPGRPNCCACFLTSSSYRAAPLCPVT